MKTLYSFLLLGLISLPIMGLAQHKAFHLTLPSATGIDTIDAGVMCPYSALALDNVWIHNPTEDTLTYNLSLGSSVDWYIFIGNSLAASIPPHDSIRAIVYFNADFTAYPAIGSKTKGIWYVEVHSNKNSSKIWYEELHGLVYFSGEPTTETQITVYRDQVTWNNLLKLDSIGTDNFTPYYSPIKSCTYVNRQDSTVQIQSIFVPKGSHFTITGSTQYPIVLQKNDSCTINFSYSTIADTVGWLVPHPGDSTQFDTIYNDLAVVITDITYPLSAANYKGFPPKTDNTASIHSRQEEIPVIKISNNPIIYNTEITIERAALGSISIYNALGTRVAENSGISWNWLGNADASTQLPNGVYTIEAKGISNEGKPFEINQKVILMK